MGGAHPGLIPGMESDRLDSGSAPASASMRSWAKALPHLPELPFLGDEVGYVLPYLPRGAVETWSFACSFLGTGPSME